MKKQIFFILLGLGILLLIGGAVVIVPVIKNMYTEMGEIIDRQAEYKRNLRQYAFEDLNVKQEALLTRLLTIIEENESNQETISLDAIFSTDEYLSYINTEYNTEYTDYLSYINSMPNKSHRMVLYDRLKTVLDAETSEEEKDIWLDFYYTVRDWSKKGKSELNNRKEFQEILTKDLVEPLMKHSASGFSVKSVQMGLISAMMTGDSELFHRAWQSRIRTKGEEEGILFCAIVTPDEFALMRSFFDDDVSFKKWIIEPFEILEPVESEVEK
ncbi:hypothetical protein JT359_03040 [Candidatus Poribacteria bacterium]|nr:hypothetical protein [Candidatus Poribacteria bacterium]